VKLLTDNHCYVNVISSKGSIALICAAKKGCLECVKLLIDNHYDVNVSNSNGDTARILGAGKGHLKCETTY
jgi:ankyrin repeat protein